MSSLRAVPEISALVDPAHPRSTWTDGWSAVAARDAFKLIESAQARWRAVNTPHLVALVRAGATLVNGVLCECEEATVA